MTACIFQMPRLYTAASRQGPMGKCRRLIPGPGNFTEIIRQAATRVWSGAEVRRLSYLSVSQRADDWSEIRRSAAFIRYAPDAP